MAKLYKSTKHSPLLWQAQKAGIQKNELCKRLGISYHTLSKWIENPDIMQLKHITILAGLFGLQVEELVYMLLRNKPQMKTNSHNGVFYIENIRDKYK